MELIDNYEYDTIVGNIQIGNKLEIFYDRNHIKGSGIVLYTSQTNAYDDTCMCDQYTSCEEGAYISIYDMKELTFFNHGDLRLCDSININDKTCECTKINEQLKTSVISFISKHKDILSIDKDLSSNTCKDVANNIKKFIFDT
jgi:hypothetical protein